MNGHLHLVCGFGGDGIPCLKQQSFRAPFHLSKPHVDEGALVVNVVNPTAGMFDGDDLDLDVRVEKGAHLALTTPSASRVFQSRTGNAARMRQRFLVEEDGALEFLPEPLIPHKGSVYEQSTEIRVETGGTLLFFEWLAPGRVASGEVFEFGSIAWNADVWQGGVLSVREQYRLSPDDTSLAPLTSLFPTTHYLGCFACGLESFPSEQVEALQSESCHLGWSALAGGGWAIKSLCENALTTRKLMSKLRHLLHAAMGRKPPALGRY